MSTGASIMTSPRGDASYDPFLDLVKERFSAVASSEDALFTTNIDPSELWNAYLANLPEREQQVHTCNTCRAFMHRAGGLVRITPNGKARSALWRLPVGEVPAAYRKSVISMLNLLESSQVTGVFVSSETAIGRSVTGDWRHLSVDLPDNLRHRGRILSPGQRAAELREDFRILSQSLGDFDISVLRQALHLLESATLYRSERTLGPARFLFNLARDRDRVAGTSKRNITWLAAATAPAGFCHPRTTMVGTLLEDIASGMTFERASRRFLEKMRPDQYQRPQSLPSAQNVWLAEKIVKSLNASGSFARRYCRIDEIQALWRSPEHSHGRSNDDRAAELFSDVETKRSKRRKRARVAEPMEPPAKLMTWDRFSAEILPKADRIEFKAQAGLFSFAALVTASNHSAPPIIQWDDENLRNPVSWYVWNNAHGGSPASQFNLSIGFHDVDAICMKPCFWNNVPSMRFGRGVIFVISGARETKKTAGISLFPEILKSEFRSVRSTIEAFSKGKRIEGIEEPHACGLLLDQGPHKWSGAIFRVTNSIGDRSTYELDRWS